MGFPGEIEHYWLWLALGLALAALEMVVPGVYLIWLALAALTTGLIVFGSDQLFAGAMPTAMQVVSFVFLSLIYAFSARRWLRDSPIVSADPMLNNRGARMVGEMVLVTTAIEHGRGRVRLGDSDWMARGPDIAAGEWVRVKGTDGSTLLVEPLNLIEG